MKLNVRSCTVLVFILATILLALAFLVIRSIGFDVIINWVWSSDIFEIDSLITLTAVLLFAGLMVYARFERQKPSEIPVTVRYWVIGIVIVTLLNAGVILIVNPRAYYGSRLFTPRLQALNEQKVLEYPVLNPLPDIVVLGTSRARTLNSTYSESHLSNVLYNASVPGGDVLDSLTFLRFMNAQTNNPFPKVLLIEVSPGSSRYIAPNSSNWPLRIFPYMDQDMLQRALEDRAKGLVSLGMLSDAITAVLYSLRPPTIDWTFGPDGSGNAPLLSDSQMRAAVQAIIENDINNVWCESVNDGFRTVVDEILTIAERRQAGVVFYVSPRNPEYYAMLLQSPTYEQCSEVYAQYFAELQETRENLYYIDVSDPTPLGLESTPEYFYDAYHITRIAADRVMDALSDALHAAYMYAEGHRS